MKQNELSGNELNIHKGISAISHLIVCYYFFSELNDHVIIFKRVTIVNFTSLNVYDNPSFSSELIVFFQEREYPWLTLNTFSIKNGDLGVFSANCFFMKMNLLHFA
jgi:hypothetical protein